VNEACKDLFLSGPPILEERRKAEQKRKPLEQCLQGGILPHEMYERGTPFLQIFLAKRKLGRHDQKLRRALSEISKRIESTLHFQIFVEEGKRLDKGC